MTWIYVAATVVVFLTLVCEYSILDRVVIFTQRNPEVIFRLGYSCFFGIFGLTVRSLSFEDREESPFPPYAVTYPVIVLGACGALTALPLEGYRFFLSVPVAAFVIGYLPMDSVDSIRQRLGSK